VPASAPVVSVTRGIAVASVALGSSPVTLRKMVELVVGARVGFNDAVTMGSWGQGARSALPVVREVFQQRCAISGSIRKSSSIFRGLSRSRVSRKESPCGRAAGSVPRNHESVESDFQVDSQPPD
jgi:hypothetical protein